MPPAHISRVRAPKRPRHKGKRDLHDDLRRGDSDPKEKKIGMRSPLAKTI